MAGSNVPGLSSSWIVERVVLNAVAQQLVFVASPARFGSVLAATFRRSVKVGIMPNEIFHSLRERWPCHVTP